MGALALAESKLYTDQGRLIRRLRDILAGANLSAQDKLNEIVQLVATELHSEVCSIYIKSSNNVLILFATQGLNPMAVHFTRLRIGEGVVGDVAAHARPVVVTDIKVHPSFAYRPETGEDELHGFVGVPICRGGRLLGVLVLQTKTKRYYTFDEVDILQTISMVLAELISSQELLPLEVLRSEESLSWISAEYSGVGLNLGVALGTAVFHQAFPVYSRKTVENLQKEKKRLHKALVAMQLSLKGLFSRQDLEHSGDHRDVFEVYRMLAFDRGWHHRLNLAIERGLSAEAAVETVLDDMKNMINRTGDMFWRARLLDFEDLSGRLMHFLSGVNKIAPQSRDERIILVAKSIGPAELLDYEPGSVAGLILEEGMQAPHVAIVARALEIPVVTRVNGILLKVEPGDKLLVDGDNGKVIVRPGGRLLHSYEEKIQARARSLSLVKDIIREPAITKDGVRISLRLNAGLPMDVDRIESLGLDGIGLYRTEIPFMLENSLPDLLTQRNHYREVLNRAKGKPVVFRTLDVGGDKVVPYIEMPKADNPAMGWRAVRISLDRPALFRVQIRALLQAAAGEHLYIKIPMVTIAAEFRQARELIHKEIEQAKKDGRFDLPLSINVGVMLEVPSLYYELKALLPMADFLSVGTNDLLQFFYATDRSNILLNKLYDPLSFGFLSFLEDILAACNKANVPLHLCGELASFPVEAMVLMGLGFESLSIAGASVGRIKLMIRSLDLASFRTYLRRLMDHNSTNIRLECQAYALDHGIQL